MTCEVEIDALKAHTGFDENFYGEHKYGSINPFLHGNGGDTWLPGLAPVPRPDTARLGVVIIV